MVAPLEWNELWMRMAVLVGQKSRCTRAQYGAVIVSSDNRVLSVGYNGPPAGLSVTGTCKQWCARSIAAAAGDEVSEHYLDCDAVHAEANALLRAPNLWLENEPLLFVNGVTCHRCALTIANSGIKTVHMLVTEYEAKRNPSRTAELLNKYGVKTEMTVNDGA